jgi:hypothetical protein
MRNLIAGAIASALAAFGLAPLAFAAPHNPTGEFAQFADCPLSQKGITDCILSVSDDGLFTVGKKTVPIVNPVILTGGFKGVSQNIDFFGAEQGETLSRAPQPVPGGLRGVRAPAWWPESLQTWFDEQIGEGITDVKATLELAAPATSVELNTENLINREGVALGLPVKFKLENPILGDNCYIGSNSKPIQIDFKTTKSGSVEGSPGNLSFNKKYTLITIRKGRLVNGTFTAPGASGCGGLFSVFIDPLVNSLLGGPSTAGKSTAILEGKLQDGSAAAVRETE